MPLNGKAWSRRVYSLRLRTVPNDYVLYPYSPAATVRFDQPTYSVNEDGGPVQPALVLSNPLSTDITVEVFNTDGSATGKYYNINY